MKPSVLEVILKLDTRMMKNVTLCDVQCASISNKISEWNESLLKSDDSAFLFLLKLRGMETMEIIFLSFSDFLLT